MSNSDHDLDAVEQESMAKESEETKITDNAILERENVSDYVKRLFTENDDDIQSYTTSTSSSTQSRQKQQPEEYDVRRMSSAQKFFNTPVKGVPRKYDLASAVSFGGAQSLRKQNRNQAEFSPMQIVKTKHQMLRKLGIDEETRSDKIIFAQEASRSSQNNNGEVSYTAVNVNDVLKEDLNPQPQVWLLALVVSYYKTRNVDTNAGKTKNKIITTLSTSGKVDKPDSSLKPPALPQESKELYKFYAWNKQFRKHVHKHCFPAYLIWTTGDVKFPISPPPSEFALWLESNGYDNDNIEFNNEFFALKE